MNIFLFFHIINYEFTGVILMVLPMLSTGTILLIWLSTENYVFRQSNISVDRVDIKVQMPTEVRKRKQQQQQQQQQHKQTNKQTNKTKTTTVICEKENFQNVSFAIILVIMNGHTCKPLVFKNVLKDVQTNGNGGDKLNGLKSKI